jgi:hypothetical protein
MAGIPQEQSAIIMREHTNLDDQVAKVMETEASV